MKVGYRMCMFVFLNESCQFVTCQSNRDEFLFYLVFLSLSLFLLPSIQLVAN